MDFDLENYDEWDACPAGECCLYLPQNKYYILTHTSDFEISLVRYTADDCGTVSGGPWTLTVDG